MSVKKSWIYSQEGFIMDAFPDFFENALGFATKKLTTTYTGPCLRVQHPVSLVEENIGFRSSDNWIDAEAAQDFLETTDAGGSPLRVTRCYLQGLNESGGLYLDNNAMTACMDLVIDTSNPANCYLEQNNAIQWYTSINLQGGNLRVWDTSLGWVNREGYYLNTSNKFRQAYYTVVELFDYENSPNDHYFLTGAYNVPGEYYLTLRLGNMGFLQLQTYGLQSVSFFSPNGYDMRDDLASFSLVSHYRDQWWDVNTDPVMEKITAGKADTGYYDTQTNPALLTGDTGSIESPEGFGGSLRFQAQTGNGTQSKRFKCWIKSLDAKETGFDNMTEAENQKIIKKIEAIFGVSRGPKIQTI